ncbi:hypothetical protein [Neisseria sicca]|uniref:hypothetical protein n=1 Tax=Neisseria sicca TaxID=490 RepID=UPI000D2FCDF0|nr:hypothetical protein [Neisseria sicca]
MKKLKVENLFLTKSIYIYKDFHTHNKESRRIDLIRDILALATNNKIKSSSFILNIFRKNFHNFHDIKYTVRVFLTDRPIYFLKEISAKANEDERTLFSKLKDKIHAYIILIEYKDYICILKKSCADISSITEERLTLIDLHELGKIFTEDAKYKKMAFKLITSSNRDVNSKTLHAYDLKGALPLYGAGRSIVSGFQVSNKGTLSSITSTGRFTENAQRSRLENIFQWIKIQVDKLEESKDSVNSFLKNFSKKVNLENLPRDVIPDSLMIDGSGLSELIENLSSDIFYKNNENNFLILDDHSKKILFGRLENLFPIKNKDNHYVIEKIYTVKPYGDKYKIFRKNNLNENENDNKLNMNLKSITFSIDLLKRLYIDENGEKVNLNKFIIKNKLYSITFTDFKYMYLMGGCFYDTSGSSEVMELLSMLHPFDEMNSINDEKGTKKLNKRSKNFPKISMFNFIEEVQKEQGDDYIFCDDQGDEWADHITFNQKLSRICFIHSKHGKQSTSASNLHDVVGQGIKNLGNMFFSKDQIWNMKFENGSNKKFFTTYNIAKKQTNIPRLRLGNGNPDQIKKYLENLLKDKRLYRECILSCSFLSKKMIESEFLKLESQQPISGNITQLFWILSSFSHACKERGITPIIYCNN